MARAVYWCEDDWMKVENLPHSACYGNHAVVLARYVVSRVFPKDVKLLSSLDLAQNLDQLPNDSEIVDYLHLFNSESQVNVTLEQGNNTFNVKWLLSATQGISTYFGIEPEPVETILARVLVVALASRGILQRNPAATFPVSNSDQRDVWWCVEDRVTVNDVTNSHCFGKHTVLKVKSALRRQFQRDIDALKDFQPPQDLPDDKVIDGLHLLQCESVNCKITLHHKDGTFSAEWDSPINKVVKCSSAFSKIVLAETVLARILVEVLTSQGHLQEQDMVESLSIPLGHSNAGSPMSHQPPESPSSATTLLNATSSDSASDGVHEPLHPVQLGADEKERTDDPIVKEESMGVHEPLHPVQFGADEEERTDDPIVKEESMDQEPMDTAAPQNSVEGAINIHAASAPFKFPSRAQLRKISMHGPKEKKQEVLCMLRSKEAISNLKRFTGLHCNVDEEWSRQFLECAVKCNKLHEVEVVWPSREHWELIHELRFLRRLEIYVIGELYKNPHTVELPIDHAQLIEAIQAEGLHPVSLASLLEAHRGSLKRLEVLVDLPGVSTRPKDSGRPLSDAELRELLERALGTLSQSSQELNVSTKLVREAPAEALPASMFLTRGRHVGCGCSGPVRGRQKKELYCENAVPVEEDCRRYPKLQVVMLTRPVEGLHNRKSCSLQIQALRREWPSIKIFCGKCSKKEGKPKARLRKRKIDGSRKGCEFRI